MKTITLQVPEGNKCSDCMFLDYTIMSNNVKCLLFNEPLNFRLEYGHIDKDTIRKCDRCREATN